MNAIRRLSEGVSRVRASLARMSLYDIHYQGRKLMRWLVSFGGRRSLPVFSELALETTAHCNRHCPACPVSVAPRGHGVMDGALFDKLLAELAAMRYAGRISLHFFNEPLLDPQIVAKVRRIASAAPRACIEIFSNGDFLTVGLAEELFAAGLSFMLITAYNDRAMRRLVAMKPQFSSRTRRRIVIRRAEVLANNRAGSLAEMAIFAPLKADCFQPSYHLTINYKGEAVICSSDFFAASVMGHVGDQTLLEIWRGPAFQAARRLLRERRRNALPACKGCNVLSTPLRISYLTPQEAARHNRLVRSRRPTAGSRRSAEAPLADLRGGDSSL